MLVLQRESSRRLEVRGLVGLDEVVPVAVRRRLARFPPRRALECRTLGL
jgi:hypothetical protein